MNNRTTKEKPRFEVGRNMIMELVPDPDIPAAHRCEPREKYIIVDAEHVPGEGQPWFVMHNDDEERIRWYCAAFNAHHEREKEDPV